MDELLASLSEPWLQRHPHICAVLLIPIVLALAHLYSQTWTIRRVFGMRNGDGLWIRPPRYGKKPPRKAGARSKMLTDDDKTPPNT